MLKKEDADILDSDLLKRDIGFTEWVRTHLKNAATEYFEEEEKQ